MDKLEFIFNTYKDSIIITKYFKREVAKKYKLSPEEVRNMWVRINNYQINKYGERLSKETGVNMTLQEIDRARQNANQRRYAAHRRRK